MGVASGRGYGRITHEESLPHVVGWALNDKGMNDHRIVDVDEEGDLLFSCQSGQVDSLELSSGTHVRLKLFALTDTFVVYMLKGDA